MAVRTGGTGEWGVPAQEDFRGSDAPGTKPLSKGVRWDWQGFKSYIGDFVAPNFG
jgi:hypothetical protein